MVGGGCPPPVSSWCPGHAGVESEPTSLFASLPVPHIPQWDSSLGALRLGNPYCRFVALRQGLWSPNAVSLTMPSCATYVGGLPETPMPSPPHAPNTALSLATSPCIIFPFPSSAAHKPPLTGWPLPDRHGRPFRRLSRRFSSYTPDQIALPGCWTPPAVIPGLMTLPCHNPRRRGHFGVWSPVQTQPARLIYILSPLPSDKPLHPLPHWIWWGTERTTALPPWNPGKDYRSSPLLTEPSATNPSMTSHLYAVVIIL